MMKNQPSLWSANEVSKNKSELNRFCKQLERKKLIKYPVTFDNLWKWSVKNPEIFGLKYGDFTKIRGNKGKIIIKKIQYFTKILFPDSKLNYAEKSSCKKR